MKNQLYRIGLLAEKGNVSVQTIRYYERINLLVPKLRRESKQIRFYDDASLKDLFFIKNSQDLGFQLEDIKELLKLKNEQAIHCTSVKKKFSDKLLSIQDRIRLLQEIEKNLEVLIAKCDSNLSKQCCPIITDIESPIFLGT